MFDPLFGRSRTIPPTLQLWAVWPRAVRFPVAPPEARASSATVTDAVGVTETAELARSVIPEGDETPWVPLCANEATRRRPSPEASSDGPWMKTVLRLYFPLLPSSGFAVSTPLYARTDPAAPVGAEKENV